MIKPTSTFEGMLQSSHKILFPFIHSSVLGRLQRTKRKLYLIPEGKVSDIQKLSNQNHLWKKKKLG